MVDNEQQAYADYLRSQGMSDEQVKDQMMFDYYQAHGAVKPETHLPMLAKAGHGILKALDYTSALGRGGIALGAQELSGKNLGLDLAQVLKGQAPDTAELMRRGDVPEMDFAGKEGLGKYVPSGRTMLGFAGDVLADPVTYVPLIGQTKAAANLAKSLSNAGKVGEIAAKGGQLATDGLNMGLRNAGVEAYKSGLKDIDKAGARIGKVGAQAPSAVLRRNGMPTGSSAHIKDEMGRIAGDLEGQVSQHVDDATNAGARVNVDEIAKPAQDYIDKLRSQNHPTEGVQAQIDAMQRNLDQYKATKPGAVDFLEVAKEAPTPKTVRNWKTMDQAAVGDWDLLSKSSIGKKYQKALATGERQAIENSVERAGLTSADALRQANADLGSLISKPVTKAARTAAEKEAARNLFTSVDGVLGAAASVAAPATSGLSFAVPVMKKVADISKTTGARTRTGKALLRAGENSPETFWRQLLNIPRERDETKK
jgi:hypothetical protein